MNCLSLSLAPYLPGHMLSLSVPSVRNTFWESCGCVVLGVRNYKRASAQTSGVIVYVTVRLGTTRPRPTVTSSLACPYCTSPSLRAPCSCWCCCRCWRPVSSCGSTAAVAARSDPCAPTSTTTTTTNAITNTQTSTSTARTPSVDRTCWR